MVSETHIIYIFCPPDGVTINNYAIFFLNILFPSHVFPTCMSRVYLQAVHPPGILTHTNHLRNFSRVNSINNYKAARHGITRHEISITIECLNPENYCISSTHFIMWNPMTCPFYDFYHRATVMSLLRPDDVLRSYDNKL